MRQFAIKKDVCLKSSFGHLQNNERFTKQCLIGICKALNLIPNRCFRECGDLTPVYNSSVSYLLLFFPGVSNHCNPKKWCSCFKELQIGAISHSHAVWIWSSPIFTAKWDIYLPTGLFSLKINMWTVEIWIRNRPDKGQKLYFLKNIIAYHVEWHFFSRSILLQSFLNIFVKNTTTNYYRVHSKLSIFSKREEILFITLW